MKLTVRPCAIVALMILTACSKSNPSETLAKLEERVAEIEKESWQLQAKVETLEAGNKTGYFAPGSPGFQRVDSETGTFLVSMEDVKPYANGFKVTFRLGNPSLATFENTDISIAWGAGYGQTGMIRANTQKHTLEQTILTPLRPGSWNRVTFVLSPAEKTDIEAIEITLKTRTVSLRR